jgi:acetylornithine deacetylase/succinyl-diaminopimelate desuccinylase-like protein
MGKPLNRDVVFMATADEEAGGFYGAGWLAKNRSELFEDMGLLLNEGGSGTVRGNRTQFGIEVTQKVPLWIRLVATGEPGHGSSPGADSAVTRLIQALSRIHEYSFPPKINPAVDAYFKAMAPHTETSWREAFQDIETAAKDPAFVSKLQTYNRGLHSLIRNTCSITRLDGSSKINVIPPSASAEIDCRLVPHQDPQEFIETLRRIIDDPAIEIETIMVFSPAVSPTDTDLYRAILAVCKRHFPDAAVMPSVSTGFTDSHFFRDMGIACYGFSPIVLPAEEWSGVHGNNEKISVVNVKLGTRLTLEILQELVH